MNVAEEKPQKRGGKPIVKITRQQLNKINKHMDTAVKRIEDEKKEDESEEDEEDEDEEEEEESESPVKSKKSALKVELANRKIVKVSNRPVGAPSVLKKAASVAKKGAALSQPAQINVKSAKAASKKLPKIGAKTRKPADDEDDEESKGDEEMADKEEASESAEIIDTKAPSKAGTKKRANSLPKVGQKRMHKSKKGGDDDDDEGDEDEDASAMDGGDEDSEGPVKKRKLAAGKSKAEKPKKAPKRPTEFKKGKWNPHVELLDHNKYREHPQDELFIECCIRCNNRNVIRAAYTGNEKLLKAGIAAKEKISQLTAYWSADVYHTAL